MMMKPLLILFCAVTAGPLAEGEPASVPENPPVNFRVLDHRRIEVDEQAVVLNRVAPPVLLAEPATPAPPAAQEIASTDALAAAQPARKTSILFLSATVYDRKVTEISFFGSQGRAAIFSNIDFNLLDGFGSFATDDTVYSLMLALSNQTANDAITRNRELAGQGVKMGAARIPQAGDFSATRSECLVVEDADHPAPTGEELAALHALHVFFDANKQRLAEGYALREAARADEARRAQTPPPVPPDIVIHYWKNDPATNAAPSEGQAR